MVIVQAFHTDNYAVKACIRGRDFVVQAWLFQHPGPVGLIITQKGLVIA